jgi:hypothetical protein
MVTVGGPVSRVTVIVSIPVFPTTSLAMTVMRFAPGARSIWALQVSVPVAVPEPPVRAFVQTTLETELSSVAVPPTSIGVVTVPNVGALVGVSMVTTGGAASLRP